ncbi:uncharacterized protein [Procambarus clarkii]|uniref:uncharacterized protein n=1 Tax=Procambarus clarkii TaxID=6728 RepID=UPI001E6781E6|nr:mycosin-2-like [Procambarus clarkii]
MSLPDSSSCHHCHIHAPIPARDLKRTHPLRSHFVDKSEDAAQPGKNELANNSFKKNVSFLYRKINRKGIRSLAKESQTNVTIPIPPPVPTRVVDARPAVVVDSVPLPDTPPRSSAPVGRRVRRRRRGMAGLQAVLLVGAYALLLVLAVVIGVVLSQNPRRVAGRPRFPDSQLAPRPVFRDAAPAPAPAVRAGRPRFPPPSGGSPRIGAPRQGGGVPLPPPPPTTAPPEPEFDYVYVDDSPQDLRLAPSPVPSHFPTNAPSPQSFRPQPAPAPRPPVAQQEEPRRPSNPSPRRTTVPLASLDRDFSLHDDQAIRGRKEPEVKILRSWSHQNADGTFSWGYINDDGSYKNETRGLDCVVRGVYGYIDKATGEQLSFPYESGNPCDPDAPDYYYDYEAGSPATDGAPPRPAPKTASLPPRRQG